MWKLQLALVAVALIPLCQAGIWQGSGLFEPGHEGECNISGHYVKINETLSIPNRCELALCYDTEYENMYYYEIHTCITCSVEVPSDYSGIEMPVRDLSAEYPRCCGCY